jgi:hypothetical protein
MLPAFEALLILSISNIVIAKQVRASCKIISQMLRMIDARAPLFVPQKALSTS